MKKIGNILSILLIGTILLAACGGAAEEPIAPADEPAASAEKVTDEDIGYGVNLQLRYESLRYNVTDFLEDNIDDVYNLSQLRFAVGLNVYF